MIDDNIDRRLVVKFTTLKEKKEKEITSELISMMYYYYLKTGISKNPDSNKVFEYYDKHIKKPHTIHKLLRDFNVQIDSINYIKETYNMIVVIMDGLEDDRQKFFIDETKEYQRVNSLTTMIYLLDKNKENEKVRDIIEYLKKHGINEDNISADYIKRIINKIYEVL